MSNEGQQRIAVLTHDSLGNYVVATPLIALFRRERPDARLDYVGGARTRALWERERGWDRTWSYDDAPSAAYDLVLSTERDAWAVAHAERLVRRGGRILGPGAPRPAGLAADPDWTARDLKARYPELTTGFIAEIYARCAGLAGPVGPYALPREPAEPHGCDLLISCSASLDEKLWPLERWREALEPYAGRVGLVGVKPKPGAPAYCGQSTEDALAADPDLRVADLRGRYTLPALVRAVEAARAVLTIDNGVMHLAAATETPVVALFRPAIERLWRPPHAPALAPLSADPVAAIRPARVADALQTALARAALAR